MRVALLCQTRFNRAKFSFEFAFKFVATYHFLQPFMQSSDVGPRPSRGSFLFEQQPCYRNTQNQSKNDGRRFKLRRSHKMPPHKGRYETSPRQGCVTPSKTTNRKKNTLSLNESMYLFIILSSSWKFVIPACCSSPRSFEIDETENLEDTLPLTVSAELFLIRSLGRVLTKRYTFVR